MAAASGIPGIVTTPKPPDGPASSLTAIGPLACTRIGIEPGGGERRAGHDRHDARGQRARGDGLVARTTSTANGV